MCEPSSLLLSDVSGLLDKFSTSHHDKLQQKRDEIERLRAKLRLARDDNVRLKQHNDSLVEQLASRDQDIASREEALREHIRRSDRELHTKWEMLFAAQQRLGEQESAFAAMQERLVSTITPSATPGKKRRTISSPIGGKVPD